MADTDTKRSSGEEAKQVFRFDRDVDEETGETVEILDAGTVPSEKTAPEKPTEAASDKAVEAAKEPPPATTVKLEATEPPDKVEKDPPQARTVIAPVPPPPEAAKPEPVKPAPAKPEWKPISAPAPEAGMAPREPTHDANEEEDEEETLASLIAGRRLETPEAERTFLLTLSRDQRLRYADLVQVNERLDFEREKLAIDEERIAVDRDRIASTDRARRETHAADFGRSVLRLVVGLNGAGCLVLIVLWATLAALGAPANAENFRFSLWGFALGTTAGVVAAACAYARHWFLGVINRAGKVTVLATVFRSLAGLAAGLGLILFVVSVIYVGMGLDVR